MLHFNLLSYLVENHLLYFFFYLGNVFLHALIGARDRRQDRRPWKERNSKSVPITQSAVSCKRCQSPCEPGPPMTHPTAPPRTKQSQEGASTPNWLFLPTENCFQLEKPQLAKEKASLIFYISFSSTRGNSQKKILDSNIKLILENKVRCLFILWSKS